MQLGLFYSYLPFMVLPIYASVERYNFALSEAPRIFTPPNGRPCGASCCPLSNPAVIAGCILVFVPSLGAFLAPDLLGGAKNFMIGSLIEEQFKGNAGNWPFGAAASMILLSMVLVVLFLLSQQRRRREPHDAHDRRQNLRGFFTITISCLVILYAPWSWSTVYSFNALGRSHVGGRLAALVRDVFCGPESCKVPAGSHQFVFDRHHGRDRRHGDRDSRRHGMVQGGKFRLRTPSFGLISLPIMVPEIVLAVRR